MLGMEESMMIKNRLDFYAYGTYGLVGKNGTNKVII